MIFDLNSTLLIIAISQFLFLGLFLVSHKKGKRTSNYLLGTFFIACSANLVFMFFTEQGRFDLLGLFSFMDLALLLAYGPLIFFYSKTVIYKDFNLKVKALIIHFLPFILFSILTIINYITTPDDVKQEALEKIYNYELTFAQGMSVIPFYLHILLYLFLSVKEVKRYKRIISEGFSDLAPYSLGWLWFLLKSFIAVTGFSILTSFLPYTRFKELTPYILVGFIALTFYVINRILFKALKQPNLFSGIELSEMADKYTKSKLTDEDKTKGFETLNKLMAEEKPFLNPSLSLNGLAEMVQMKPRELSQIINEKTGSSFYDFINRLRVQYAQKLMQESTDSKMTILEILYQSGFNSKSSFNTAFKKVTSSTPSEYRKKLTRNQ